MRKRFLAMVMGLVLTVAMLTGCTGKGDSDSSSNTASSGDVSSSEDASSSNTDSESSNSSDSTNAEINENTIYGKVTSVSSDGKITYEVLSKDENQPQMPQGSGAPDAKKGEKPQMPQGSGAPDAKKGEKPQMPQGSGAPDAKKGGKPQMPQGSGAPDRKNNGMPGFKSTGETSTITVGENAVIQKAGLDQNKKDATLSDIKKGSIIEIVVSGENVSNILIREDSGKADMGKQSENKNGGSQENSDNTNSAE